MMECLQMMNVENNVIGWYQSCLFENYLDSSFIETQYNYQLNYGKKCVCILFDTVQSLSTGLLRMKAIRITDSFMEILREAHRTHTKQLTQEILTRLKFDPSEVIEELQITITNSNLFSKSLKKQKMKLRDDVENNQIFIEKLLENIIEYSEMFIQEENKFQYFQRKQKKKTTEEESSIQSSSVNLQQNVVSPNRLESLLISTQMKDSIAEMENLISLSKKKLEISNKI